MRRWTGLLSALSLLAVVAGGCHHTAGVCDCDTGHHAYHPGMDGLGYPVDGHSAAKMMPQASTSTSVQPGVIPHDVVSTPAQPMPKIAE
jgi:hypothetical protein